MLFARTDDHGASMAGFAARSTTRSAPASAASAASGIGHVRDDIDAVAGLTSIAVISYRSASASRRIVPISPPAPVIASRSTGQR